MSERSRQAIGKHYVETVQVEGGVHTHAHLDEGGATDAELAAVQKIMGEEPPIPEEVHERARAAARALFELDE